MPHLDKNAMQLESLSNRIATASSVLKIIDDIRSTYKLAHVTYHLVRNPSDAADSPYVRTTYPPEWVGAYVVRQYVDKDPVVRAAISRSAPFDWASLSHDPFYDEVMDAASQFGISRNGFSVPIVDKFRRRAVFSLNSGLIREDWQDQLALHGRDWVDLGHQIHRKVVRDVYGQDSVPKLGPREIECLTWTARGMEAKVIAIILKLSEHTVRTYLKSARHKLGCGTLSQAVSQALKYHLIAP